MDVDAVWSALAHPARRRLADLLRDGPAPTGRLHESLADAGLASSRFATQRHLKVLRDAGLVLVTERGRERLNTLNGTALYQATIGWLDPTSRRHAARLDALRHHLEHPSPKEHTMEIRHIDVTQRLDVAADHATVWTALVDDVSAWWGAPYLLLDGTPTIAIEPRLGGLVSERLRGREALWGVVSDLEPGRLLAWNGRMGMSDSSTGTVTFTLTSKRDAEGSPVTTVEVHHESIGAFGEGMQASYDDGWDDLLHRLQALVEHGEKHGVAGTNDAVGAGT